MNRRWILVLIGFAIVSGNTRADDAAPRLRLKAQLRGATIQPGEDPGLSVRVECRDQNRHEFRFGSVPQLFRIDIVGPWGPIPEGPDEGSREARFSWMHQEHSTAQRIVLDSSHPFAREISLRDYFPIGTSNVFRPGRYWIHVKFYSTELGMKNPIDARPIPLTVKPPAESNSHAGQPLVWRPLLVGKLATVSVAKTLFEREGGKYFLAGVRITNTSNREIGVDLRSRQRCVRINQWSATDAAERGIIDESRAIPVPFTADDQAKLVGAFRADKLARIPAGRHVDYYCPFLGEERLSNRAALEKLPTRFVILSMDGELWVTNGEQSESLRCGEPGEADISIQRPVPWRVVPGDARILSD